MEMDTMKYIADAAKFLSIGICSLVMISVAKWVTTPSFLTRLTVAAIQSTTPTW